MSGHPACSCWFLLPVASGSLRRTPVEDSLKGAHARPYGDSFLWSRHHSAGDASPIIAATLAAAAVVNDRQDG
jgi:hypothetical protein